MSVKSRFFKLFTIFLVFISFLIFSSFSLVDFQLAKISFSSSFSWLTDNWLLCSFVVSELAALLPGKVSGILSGILLFGNKLFSNNSNNPKKKSNEN